jgi:hypothetical protein
MQSGSLAGARAQRDTATSAPIVGTHRGLASLLNRSMIDCVEGYGFGERHGDIEDEQPPRSHAFQPGGRLEDCRR